MPAPAAAWKAVFAAMLAGVLWLALTPQPPDAVDTGWDKLNHVLAFAALALAGRFAFGRAGGVVRMVALALALLGLGVAIELAQAWLPPRAADGHDVVADAAGIATGLLLATAAAAARRRWRTHLSSNTLQSVSSKRGCSK